MNDRNRAKTSAFHGPIAPQAEHFHTEVRPIFPFVRARPSMRHLLIGNGQVDSKGLGRIEVAKADIIGNPNQ